MQTSKLSASPTPMNIYVFIHPAKIHLLGSMWATSANNSVSETFG